MRLGLERLDWGHRFLGAHGPEYEAASRQLNCLREKKRDSKLDEQGMYDEFSKLVALVNQILGDAFDPPVEHIPAAKLIDHRTVKERIAEIVPWDVKGAFTRFDRSRRHPSVPLFFCRQIARADRAGVIRLVISPCGTHHHALIYRTSSHRRQHKDITLFTMHNVFSELKVLV